MAKRYTKAQMRRRALQDRLDRQMSDLDQYNTCDKHRVRRIERKIFGNGEVQNAYYAGEAACWGRRSTRNPYPPGLRHNAFNDGLNSRF